MAYDMLAARTAMAEDLEAAKDAFISKLDYLYNYSGSYNIDLFEDDNIILPVLSPLNTAQAALEAIDLNLPPRPELDQYYEGAMQRNHVWDTTEENEIYTSLSRMLNDSSYGLSSISGVYDVLVKALRLIETTHDTAEREYAMNTLRGIWGFTGNYIGNPTTQDANIAWLADQYEHREAERNRVADGTIARFAQQNAQAAHEVIVKLEQLHTRYTAAYAKIYIDIADYAIAIYKTDIDAAIKEIDAQISILELQVKLSTSELKKDNVKYKADIEQTISRLKSNATMWEKKIKADMRDVDAKMQSAKAASEGYKTLFNSVSNRFTDINLSSTQG